MITFEGAKLLAQLIPVLILILAVHRQWLGPEPEPLTVVGWVWYWTKGLGQSLGAGGSLVSLLPLFQCVNEGSDISGGWAWIIFTSVLLMAFAAVGIIVQLVMRSYFDKEKMERGAVEQRRRAEAARDTRRARRLRKLAQRRISLAPEGRGGMDPRSAPLHDRSS